MQRETPNHASNVYAIQRSELLDACTCNACLSIDGRVFDPQDEITHIDHFCKNCRGIWVAILKDEVDPPKIDGIPAELRKKILDAKGEPLNLVEPVVKEGSLASKFLMTKNYG